MKVTLLDSMGDDLAVVNAARVSFDKESDWKDNAEAHIFDDAPLIRYLSTKDKKLIKYLAEHNHWSPFSHCTAKFRIKAPIFVARQLAKHQVGFSWNEVSRRYVDNEPEFHIPHGWRKRAEDKKQGSQEEYIPQRIVYMPLMKPLSVMDMSGNITMQDTDIHKIDYEELMKMCQQYYRTLLAMGVCPEQARMVLPQSMMTEWIMTGSLYAWARLCNLRLKPDTQLETRWIAQNISAEMIKLFPESWRVLCLQ